MTVILLDEGFDAIKIDFFDRDEEGKPLNFLDTTGLLKKKYLAEGKTQEVVDAMDAYIQNQQQTMEHYLEDQYQIAAAAKVATVPTGEVVMVCCENSDAVMNAIKTALAA